MEVAEFQSPRQVEGAAPSSVDAGNEVPSFQALFSTTHRHIGERARRMGVPAHAVDDIVQETYVIALRRLPEFRGSSVALHAWLSSILKNVVRNYLRTTRRRGRADALWRVVGASELVDDSPGPDELADSRQTALAVRCEVAKLGPARATAFNLAGLEGRTPAEIAAATETTLQTVYSRLRAARRLVERALLRRELVDNRGRARQVAARGASAK